MHPLIEEGFKLALYGMGTVFLFLTLLVIAINLMAWTLRKQIYTSEEKKLRVLSNKTKAIIIAAISLHRKNKPNQ
ncbi:MAG: OadG family protein [Candidatus Azotimanducaceae bacterium]